MKPLLTLACAAFLVSGVQAQRIPYYDALSLRSTLVDGSRIKIGDTSLVHYYFPGVPEDRLLAAINNNPFLKDHCTLDIKRDMLPVSTLSSLGSLGELNVTTFADGLARFLVKRSEEEIASMLIKSLKDYLPGHPEIVTLLPNSVALLKTIEYYEHSNYLNTLREAVDKDFKQLLRGIINLKDVQSSSNTLRGFLTSDAGRLLLSSLELGDDILAGRKLPDALNVIAKAELLGGLSDMHVARVLKLVNILSYSVKSNDVNRHYIDTAGINAVFRDSLTTSLYLGLVWQQIHNDTNLKDLAETVLTTHNSGKTISYIRNILAAGDRLNGELQKIASAGTGSDSNKWTYYASVFRSVSNVIREQFNFPSISPTIVVPPNVDQLLKYCNATITVAQDISVRNYNAVVVDLLKLYEDIHSKDLDDSAKVLVRGFVKYGSFAANIVNAKNSEDVENAIAAIALPSGSSQIKRESCFNIALNGYLGFYGGSDVIPSIQNSSAIGLGLTAPIGIAMSWGHQLVCCREDAPWSTSLFVSIIDLGAIASFRAHNDSIAQIPTVKLGDIVSPGAFLSVGFPYTPISLGVGVQVGPNLHTVSSTTNGFRNVFYVRYSISICVDIPLVNFYAHGSN